MSITHDAVLLPRHQVGDAGFDTQIASGTRVHLLRFRFANGLDGVGVSTFGFTATETRSEALDVERFAFIGSGTFGAVAAGHL